MKKLSLKRLAAAICLVALLSTTSSCNRGYGCPNKFSAKVLFQDLAPMTAVILNLWK